MNWSSRLTWSSTAAECAHTVTDYSDIQWHGEWLLCPPRFPSVFIKVTAQYTFHKTFYVLVNSTSPLISLLKNFEFPCPFFMALGQPKTSVFLCWPLLSFKQLVKPMLASVSTFVKIVNIIMALLLNYLWFAGLFQAKKNYCSLSKNINESNKQINIIELIIRIRGCP